MDFIGSVGVTSKGNQCALTVICMLTSYVMCIYLADKSADTVVGTSLNNIYCEFGGSRKILSDNGNEFGNSPFSAICTQLEI